MDFYVPAQLPLVILSYYSIATLLDEVKQDWCLCVSS